MLEPEAQEIFQKYKYALFAIGVDFSSELIIEAIENCSQDLESKFQVLISYWCWLQTQGKEIDNPNTFLLKAFSQSWKPIDWKDEILDRDEFKSPAEKWWNKARHVDILKNLVVDVQNDIWSGGKVIFGTPSGRLFTIGLSRIEHMTWSEIIEYYQQVTGVIVERYSNCLILKQPTFQSELFMK